MIPSYLTLKDRKRKRLRDWQSQVKKVFSIVKTYDAKAYGIESVFEGCRLKGGKFDRIPVRCHFGYTESLEFHTKRVSVGQEILDYYNANGCRTMWSSIDKQCQH